MTAERRYSIRWKIRWLQQSTRNCGGEARQNSLCNLRSFLLDTAPENLQDFALSLLIKFTRPMVAACDHSVQVVNVKDFRSSVPLISEVDVTFRVRYQVKLARIYQYSLEKYFFWRSE